MINGQPPIDEALWRTAEMLARAERLEEIEQLVSAHPLLTSPEFLSEFDHRIDDSERAGRGDWWGMTRARVLLGGCRDGTLKDALFRCWTRDLLPLGPDGVRRRVLDHPALIGEHADRLLLHWASQSSHAGQPERAAQIELRRDLLRQLAADRTRELIEGSTRDEREFERSGDVASLDRALETRRRLVRDPDAPFVSVDARLANLQAVSRLLQKRFRAAGVLHDIDAAIAEAEEGAAALPEGHLVHQALLAELGTALNARFRELHDSNDIDRAIAIFGDLAASPSPPGLDTDDRLTPQVNQAIARLDRYYDLKASEDLSQAIDVLRRVVSETASSSPRRPLRLNNLAAALYVAFRDRGDAAALREAIALQREATNTKDAALQVHASAALARSLDAAAQIGDGDAQESASMYRRACQAGLQVNIGAAMWASMTWGRSGWVRGEWAEAAEAYGYASDGARLLFARQSDGERSQEVRLSQFREVGARAAFALTRAGRLDDAAVVFELSRAQLLIQALDRGRALSPAPDLDVEIPVSTAARPALSAQRLDVATIAAAAAETPLVYLASTDRGGLALVVRDGKVVSIELPRLDTETVSAKVSAFLTGLASPADRVAVVDATTRWLWDSAMGPLLETFCGREAAVLVPGGLLALLPLHAAWTSDDERPSGRLYALDKAVFSYAPSARALGVARARPKQPGIDEPIGPALIVADPESPSVPPLEFANDEADLVKWHVPEAALLAGRAASVDHVSELFAKARLCHLTCHGFANLAHPLESGVILAGDDVLSVRTIRGLHVDTRLAVLSACSTAVAGTALPDEVVAMPTGLLQAGVAGIVASLWPVADRATSILMAEFYRQLCREHRTPAVALRAAQVWMRDTTSVEKARLVQAGAGDWLPAEVAERLRASLEEPATPGHAAPWWWAAFVHVGA